MGDDYASTYLGAGGAVHVDRVRMRGVAVALAACAAAFVVGAAALVVALGATAAGLAAGGAALLTALVSALAAVLLSVVRTVVTRDEVRAQFGLWERRIPVRAVTRVAVVTMDRAERLRLRRERAADFGARAGRVHAVRVDWTDGDGTARAAYLAAEDPDLLARAIEAQRAPGRDAGVRVAAEAPAEAEDRAASEATEGRRGAGER